jgi:hypothetical protein
MRWATDIGPGNCCSSGDLKVSRIEDQVYDLDGGSRLTSVGGWRRVTFGEVFVGAALILGFLTRFSAAMGLVMSVAYLFAGMSGDNPLMVLLALPIVLVGVSAGYYGIDRYLLPFLRERRARGAGTRQSMVGSR